ncbi:MAG: hypothetical protein V7K21_25225 [Nostoc sp.]|uniref:hypothetical protein n=1 Tax=Nostoc sp. TaxID=1180 RepID=UPI002FFC247B
MAPLKPTLQDALRTANAQKHKTMTRILLTEAQLRLPELIASLQPGEEVQIFSGDRKPFK